MFSCFSITHELQQSVPVSESSTSKNTQKSHFTQIIPKFKIPLHLGQLYQMRLTFRNVNHFLLTCHNLGIPRLGKIEFQERPTLYCRVRVAGLLEYLQNMRNFLGSRMHGWEMGTKCNTTRNKKSPLTPTNIHGREEKWIQD